MLSSASSIVHINNFNKWNDDISTKFAELDTYKFLWWKSTCLLYTPTLEILTCFSRQININQKSKKIDLIQWPNANFSIFLAVYEIEIGETSPADIMKVVLEIKVCNRKN